MKKFEILPEGNACQAENLSKVSDCSHVKQWSCEFLCPFSAVKTALKNHISGLERRRQVSFGSLNWLLHRLLGKNKNRKSIKNFCRTRDALDAALGQN
jgi:hypothetical protein